MIFKIKKIFLLIFLILLQSCSGGRIGNFLESSFENLENIKKLDNSSKDIEDKQVFYFEKENSEKKNIEEIKTKEKQDNDLKNKKKLNSKKKSEKTKIIGNNKFPKKRKNALQSYKIIFILKNVDPEDPIEEFSTILRNSEVNFEIEKIERFLDSKNKNINGN